MEYLEFTDLLHAESILEWTDTIKLWEADTSNTNPFVPTTKSKWPSIAVHLCVNGWKAIMQDSVCLALVQEDAAQLAREDAG